MNIKDKDEPGDRQGAFIRSNAATTRPLILVRPGRNLNIRLTEHKKVKRNGVINNHIAEHQLKINHRIDWGSAKCVTYSTNYYQRISLESWFTNLEQTPLNHCQQLPEPYKRLTDDKNRQTLDQPANFSNNRPTDI